jgi:hypothetical protein
MSLVTIHVQSLNSELRDLPASGWTPATGRRFGEEKTHIDGEVIKPAGFSYNFRS